MRKVWGGRALLNLPGHHSTAAIIAEVEDTRAWPEGKTRGGGELTTYNAQPETTFTISDCSQSINLEIDLGTEARLENSLHKIDTMIATLRQLRKGVIKEHERLVERKAKIPQKNIHTTDLWG